MEGIFDIRRTPISPQMAICQKKWKQQYNSHNKQSEPLLPRFLAICMRTRRLLLYGHSA